MSPKAHDVDVNRQVNVAKRQSLTSIEANVLQLTMSSETSIVDADKMNVHGRSITKQSYEQYVVTVTNILVFEQCITKTLCYGFYHKNVLIVHLCVIIVR